MVSHRGEVRRKGELIHWLVSHCGEGEVGTNTLTGESSWGGEEEGKD